ncbi:MAG: CocE/NonD family hydrolase [Fimbriimonadaceae bacterium]
MRAYALLAILTTASFCHAQTVESDILFGGKAAGSNKTTRTADSLESDSAMSIAGQNIKSHLKIRYSKGMPQEISFSESAGTTSGSYEWKDGSIKATRNGKPAPTPPKLPITDKAFFATHHMALADSLFAEFVKLKRPAKMKVLEMGSLASLTVETASAPMSVTTPKGNLQIELFKLKINGIELQYAFENGRTVGFKVPAQLFEVVNKGYEGVFVDPLTKFPELSQPTFETITQAKVMSPMRDGAKLASDISRPKGDGKHPTILIRTPYGRSASLSSYEFFVKRGYVVVSQDVRGRGDSEGGWDPLNTEVQDGYDTLEWIKNQPWSDGNVGMIGGSYLGFVQWAAAASGHPALKCIIPQVSPPDTMHNIPWDHGCFMLLGNVWWARIVMDRQANMAAATQGFGSLEAFKSLPLTKVDDKFFKKDIPFYDSWLKRPTLGDWKGAFTNDQVRGVKIPVMHISGFWDGDGVGTMMNFAGQKAAGGNQWLIFGPWEHGFNVKTKFADQDFGPGAVLELDSTYLRFFDTFLKGKTANLESQPRVKFFVTGANKWIESSTWPPESAKLVTSYLGGGKPNGNTGMATLQAAPGTTRSDSYSYDPRNPKLPKSLDMSGGNSKLTSKRSSFNQSSLLYGTEKFKTPQTLGGPMEVEVYFKTTVRDAALHALVYDEAPNGDLTLVGLPGAMRIGFTGTNVKSITPGKVYKVSVKPWLFAREFKAGHRLVVMLMSDLFPKFSRIPGTGEPDATATKLLKATHTILKGAKYPSLVRYYRL